ncbi:MULTISPECIES: PD-(D/E)XK nuclease family protein [Bacillus]|uniref:PD-(D/E)XK nuclease family protein n=2 Tax=Bacillaceae TaxID=186817 RepID=UPI001CB9243C|nr:MULTISPECIES: PD-(D/E)XK nuclease family protein [Bacillus]
MAETFIKIARQDEELEQVSGNISISKTRKNFQLPGLTNAKRNEWIEETVKNKPSLLIDMKEDVMNENIFHAKPGENCRYCPHVDICSEGRHLIG